MKTPTSNIPSIGPLYADDLHEPPNYSDDKHYLYFSRDYFSKLSETIRGHISSGAYVRSNAEADWLDLAKDVLSSEDFTVTDSSRLKPHFLAK
jgi:hypothetical protein